MVIMVLLNEAFTCATPEVMFLRSRFLNARGFLGHRACAPSYFFLPAIGLAGTLAGAGVRMRALAADGQTLAVTQPAVAGEVHQALDVDGRFAAQVTFHLIFAVDRLADLDDFLVGELVHPTGVFDADPIDDLARFRLADAVYVLQAR